MPTACPHSITGLLVKKVSYLTACLWGAADVVSKGRRLLYRGKGCGEPNQCSHLHFIALGLEHTVSTNDCSLEM